MTIELRDVIAIGSMLVAMASMFLLNRNTRRSLKVQAENTDLARIRDLRQETRELKDELDKVKSQATQLSEQITAANERAITYARREAEMLRFARMPGVTIDDWLRRFDPDGTHEIAVS
jgi:signal transduction histidine kinase